MNFASVFRLALFGALMAGPAIAQTNAQTEEMLALNLYHEARQHGREAMTAVGWVVLNRVEDETFPNSIYNVITQGGETPPCQFGWWCDGKSDTPAEEGVWQLAQEISRELLAGEQTEDLTGGALFFWESWRKAPPWAKGKIEKTMSIGGNDFFKLR